MRSGSFKWGWLNVAGVRGSLEEIDQFMDDHNFSFLILGETWLKPMDPLRHPSITFDLRFPTRNPLEGRGIHGLMVVRNTKLTDASDFEEMERDTDNHSYIWFRFHGMVFGGFYLPPSMELATCIECLQSASRHLTTWDNGEPVFLVGDLNIRLGPITGDLITNLRSNIRYTLQELGLSWIRPETGKWTVCTARGRSIVDYIFANQKASKLVSNTMVWEDDFIAGSDHRLVSCDTEYQHISTLKVRQDSGKSVLPNSICRIRGKDLKIAIYVLQQIESSKKAGGVQRKQLLQNSVP